MKWYAEQIDALRAENEQLRSQVAGLELERDQALYAIRKGGPAVTEQERKDAEDALHWLNQELGLTKLGVGIGWENAQNYVRCLETSAKALRRWLDEDREDREHDES